MMMRRIRIGTTTTTTITTGTANHSWNHHHHQNVVVNDIRRRCCSGFATTTKWSPPLLLCRRWSRWETSLPSFRQPQPQHKSRQCHHSNHGNPSTLFSWCPMTSTSSRNSSSHTMMIIIVGGSGGKHHYHPYHPYGRIHPHSHRSHSISTNRSHRSDTTKHPSSRMMTRTSTTTATTTTAVPENHTNDTERASSNHLTPLERYEVLRQTRIHERRQQQQRQRNVKSNNTHAASKSKSNTKTTTKTPPPKFKMPWEYNAHEEYDVLLEDYYDKDRSQRIPKQFTLLHYNKAKESLLKFIHTNHLQPPQLLQIQVQGEEEPTSPQISSTPRPSHHHHSLLPTIHAYTNINTTTATNTLPSSSSSSSFAIPPPPPSVTAASAVNACINLLELVFYELGESHTLPKETIREISEFFCDPQLYHPIFNAWKFITIQYRKQMQWKYGKHWKQYEPQYQHTMPGEPQTLEQYDCIKDDLNIPIPGRFVLQKLIRMSHYLPRFEYDIATVNTVLQVIYLQCESPNKAPYILENVLNYILRHKKSMRRTYSGKLRMDVYTYSILLNAYCESTNLPHVYLKINELREQMRLQNLPPNVVIYNTLLRFWGKRGSIPQMQDIVQEMTAQNMPVDLACRSLLLYGYVQTAAHIPLGEAQFHDMIEDCVKPRAALDRRSIDLVQKSAHYLLDAYRKLLKFPSPRTISSGLSANAIVAKAEQVLQQLELYHLLDDPKNNSRRRYNATISVRSVSGGGAIILGSMMDIYRHVNDTTRVQEIFARIAPEHRNVVTYSILMNAYRNGHVPARAQDVLYELLDQHHIVPDIDAFNIVINAWLESSELDATERAFDILRLIEEHPKCKQYKILPNEVTYNTLLKCLSIPSGSGSDGGLYPNEGSKDAAIQAEEILNEMEQLMNDPQRRVKPDAISYTMAIRACLQANDTERAESLLRRMELSPTPPDTITYNIILNHCAKIATTAAAEKASQVLQYMITTSQQPSPQVQPQQSTSSSSKSNISHSSNNSNSNNSTNDSSHTVKPDLYSYSRVIAAWAGSGDVNASNQIWKLYQFMIHDEKLVLNMVVYTKMLAFFSKTDSIADLHRSIQVLEAMEQQQIASSNFTGNNTATNESSTSEVRPDFWHYQLMIGRAIEIGHVEIAVQIVRQSVEAYTRGITKKPKGAMYRAVVREYIRIDDLVAATNFLIDMRDFIETHRKTIGLDIGPVNELIQAWEQSNFSTREMEENIQKLKGKFFPPESIPEPNMNS